jgi:hypothetical protein
VSTDVVSAETAQQVIDAVNAAREIGGMSSTEEAAALTMESLARTVIALHARLDAVTAERDTALDECSSLARSRDYGDEMIDATREALGAADDESAVAAAQRVHRELAVLRAQLAPLLAVHDALREAAALPGAGASGAEMVAAVRKKGVAEGFALMHTVIAGLVRMLGTGDGIAMFLHVLEEHRSGREVTLTIGVKDDDAEEATP